MGEEINIGQLLNDVAYAFFRSRNYDLAMRQMEIMVDIYPMDRDVRFNAAKCSYYAEKYEAALEHIDTALMMDENNTEYIRERALYLLWLGRDSESWDMLKRLPMDERTKFNMGWHMLARNEIKKGLSYIEEGRKIGCWGNEETGIDLPRWTGLESIAGANMLIATEGGYGDEVIFARFAKNLSDMGASVTLKASDEMASTLARIEGVSNVVTYVDCKEYDYVAPAMSLPHLLGLDDVSGKPYLSPNQKYVDKWRRMLVLDPNRPNIGVRWQGGPHFEHDQRRTLPISELSCHLKRVGKLWSLQKESDVECPKSIEDFYGLLETWEDTVAVISLLDAVVTSCTSVAHVSAALGKPTYVITPIVPYFTWAEMGTRSRWYDSARVFRQRHPYGWSDAMVDMTRDLSMYFKEKGIS